MLLPSLDRATLLLAVAALAAAPAAAQAPAAYDGAVATGLALRRLGNTARLLHIGAHPDDENTALFAPLALGAGADAAYLSLTRGEGGQNGIGPELGVALGLIRSEELLAARRLDGADQFFTRAVDYGYSKDAAEAFRHWPKDSLVADAVAVIRRYRPDVVVSVWTGTPRDGHGQHQASGIVTLEALRAAGDPTRFPEQIEAGLRPHSPARVYWSARYGTDGADVELNTGRLDPLLGRSYHQVAVASRSRHRSQDMGGREAAGPRHTAFDRIDPTDPPPVDPRVSYGRSLRGPPTVEGSLFGGVDTLLSARADRLTAAEPDSAGAALDRVLPLLREYEALVARARDEYDAMAPWDIVPTLSRAQRQLALAAGAVAARAGAERQASGGFRDLHFHLVEEAADLRHALLLAANVRLDVVAGEERVVPGQTFRLELSVWNGGPRPVTADVGPLLPPGWAAAIAEGDPMLVVPPGELGAATYAVTVPDRAALTTPYYLDPTRPADNRDLYDWPADPEVRGLPFDDAPVRGAFLVGLLETGDPVAAERDAEWVGVEPRSGEYRRPVRVVPRVSVAVSPTATVLPAGRADPLDFSVLLRSQTGDTVVGELRAIVPPGWTATPDRLPVTLAAEGAERAVRVRVAPPARPEPGAHALAFELATDRGTYTLGYEVVDYPHIAPRHLYRPATASVRVLDVRVADVRVGYVAGVGDGVPEALDQLGVRWAALGEAELAAADFDRFDVIITGTRAYEVRPDLVRHNHRLLDWVRAGGTLIVQYNKYEALDGSYAPWPVTIARPHGRVADEAAPVTVLKPDHPVFRSPNPIGPADWEGWVQERGLYFWDTWQGPLEPLLAMADPGEAPLTGALLVAPLGQGTYVYSGLALFRQLPEGVPGAYRLLANLVSLGAGS